ncbi:ABC transporter substrate-binding protein [Paenibacillus protaetiae]|uniref:Extracellular solute-binding protein n=1 Tax=Paenibacillus protaetiae TaxID=2509456 RepID=A0A4P6EQY3_9BACL|nr:extracellular solute-binding protein [Paenibacillus protaetiae]QAY65390.1 extracellular solute-binding protein [Paenibacillus protaetiae]
MAFWKRFAGVSTTIVLAASLAACGSNNSGNNSQASDAPAANDSGAASGQKVKLRIMWWGAEARHQATLNALDLYTKEHPNVTFEPEYSGMDGYLDKLSTQAAAKNAPDIFQIDPSWVSDWASRGQLAELPNVDLSNVDAKLVNAGKYEDKQIAVPLGSAAEGMIYDKAALEKMGLTAPQNGWTWDDFFALAKASKPKLAQGQYFTKDYAGDYFAYSAYQYAAGKGLLVTEDGKFHIDEETFLKWTTQFQELREQGIVPPADVNASDKEFDPTGDLMVKGTILFRLGFSNNFTSWNSLKPGAYAMITMPRNVEAGGWLKPALFFGVSENSAQKEEAQKFLDWFTNDPEAVKILGTTRGNPVNDKVAAEIASSFSDADKVGIDMYNATAVDGQQWTAGASGWSNWVDKDWALVRDELSFGKVDPQGAFDELKSTAQEYEN